MRQGLRLALSGLGVLACVAGAHDVVRGVPGVRHASAASPDASVDSELRFFAAWYAVAGVALLRAARAPERHGDVVRLTAGGSLLAAAGRALSHRTIGAPHPLYTRLMAAEVAIPAVLLAWQRAVEQRTGS